MKPHELVAQNEDLRRRLEEAEETIAAIRDGAVDGFVIGDGANQRVFTLEGSDRPYRLLVERLPQGAATLQDDGSIVYANRRLAELLAVPHEKLIGSSLHAFVPAAERAAYDTVFAQGRVAFCDGEFHLARADGSIVPAVVAFDALPADCGATVGVLVTDLTARKHHERLAKAHQATSESEARRRLALAAAELGAWHFDTATGKLIADARFCDIHHLGGDEMTVAKVFARIHPDDQPRMRDAVSAALHLDRVAPFATEYRIVLAGGGVRWVYATGRSNISGFDTEHSPPSFDGTVANVTARKLAEEERDALLASERTARAEAERAGRLKDDFLATLSHELRTPLSAILGWTQILLKKGSNDPLLMQGFTVIERNARMQAQLIEDLLDMNRIMSGKLRLDLAPVDLPAVIGAAIDSIRPAAEARAIGVSSVFEPIDVPLHGDATRLQQVIWNLLSNAVKFTGIGGRVDVWLGRVGDHFEITVSDNGKGIDAQFLPHVFERFRQADASSTRQQSGLGLGLSIVKQLVELHGGDVEAASDGEGKGSLFTVRLPLACQVSTWESPTATAHGRSYSDSLAEPPDLAGVSVLVVDDEPDARDMVRHLLEECRARVVVAGSAEEAEAAVNAERFHVLVSDIGLPHQDGYSLMQSLRRAGITVPAVALTAFVRPEDRARALQAGYQRHIGKPLEPAKLLATVAALAGRTADQSG